MPRDEENVPQIAPDEVSREVDNLHQDVFRRPTTPGVPAALAEERAIADESRRYVRLARRRIVLGFTWLWITRVGSVAGLVALGLELWGRR